MEIKKDDNKLYQSILVIVIGFTILSLVFKIKLLLTIGVLIGIISLVSETVGRFINFSWTKLAEILGMINSKILISIVFYIFLFPVSLLYKLKNKDVLRLKDQKNTKTNYEERNHLYVSSDFDNLW